MGVLAPTVFESVGASTHGFWQILSEFYQFLQYEIPNERPVSRISFSIRIHLKGEEQFESGNVILTLKKLRILIEYKNYGKIV